MYEQWCTECFFLVFLVFFWFFSVFLWIFLFFLCFSAFFCFFLVFLCFFWVFLSFSACFLVFLGFGTISLGQGCKSVVFWWFRLARAANRRFWTQIWGFGVQKRGNRCDFAENQLFWILSCCFCSWEFHTFEQKMLACTAPTRKIHEKKLQTLRCEPQKPRNQWKT